MGADTVLRFSGLLRAAALVAAAAAFLLIAPSQARAADPLADAAELVGEVTAPLVEAAAPAVEALEPTTQPVVEATKPATGTVVEAAKPAADPVVEATSPIVDETVARVTPIADLPPTRPATMDEVSVHRAPLDDAERAVPAPVTIPRPAQVEVPGRSAADNSAATFTTRPAGLAAAAPITHESSGLGSPLTMVGDGLLVGMLAATLLGIAAGWQSLSLERLRLPPGLVLAPPVPPG